MAKLLIVDDEPDVLDVLVQVLSRENYIVEKAADGNEALALMLTWKYELVILDVMLPGLTGFEVCQRYRASGGDVPILMLTARSSVDDRATGLDLGADDYLSKPFHLRELLSRTRALLRRNSGSRFDQLIDVGSLRIDLRAREVSLHGIVIKMSPKEFEVLAFLARYRGVAFSAEQLVERVWHSETMAMPETVRSHIRNLRKKLDAAGGSCVIRHVRGYGYLVG